ncbi:MAG: glycosyltransferase family 2 protein [Syntrophaceae bacterium]|nr:glycosyltransferase family 2 protein [Syntrophaceae bacterium]
MFASVIIPTLNRSRLLDRTLFSLSRQITNQIFEVIIVDNGSNDNTREIVKRYENTIANLLYIYDNRPGLLVGRHIGAVKATGNILCFIDDDVIIPPYWIQGVVDVFETNNDICLATGNNYPFYESAPPAWLHHMWRQHGNDGKFLYQLSLLDFGSKRLLVDPVFVWGLNYHIRKEVFFDVGGFHPDILPTDFIYFIGDGETGIAAKIKEKNHKTAFDPRISLYHAVPTERLAKDYFIRRSYIEGMMNAYTDMRKGKYTENKSKMWSFIKKQKLILKKSLRYVKHFSMNLSDNEFNKFIYKMIISHIKGYENYTKNLEGNSLLMQYVKEVHYLDIDKIASKYYIASSNSKWNT